MKNQSPETPRAEVSSVNLGISLQATELPDVQHFAGSFGQFDRGPLTAGHQRLSPGGARPDPAAKAAGPGEDPPAPVPHPVRAEDFARPTGQPVPGSAATGAYAGVRAPVSPQEALFGAARDRFDYGRPIPVSGGQVDNNDDAALQRTNPTPDASPSIGGNISKAREFLTRGDVVGGWEALRESIDARSAEEPE